MSLLKGQIENECKFIHTYTADTNAIAITGRIYDYEKSQDPIKEIKTKVSVAKLKS